MERMPALTGLRFVAAAGVVGVHLDYWFGFTGPVHAVLRNGNLGVTFFFVLSGFVLTASYRPGRVRDFYRRRFARVYPLHLVTWTLCLLLFPVAGAGWEYLSGLFMLQGLGATVGHEGLLNTPAWSLTCEAFFYAMFPWLVVRVLRLSPAGLKRGIVGCWLAMAALSTTSFLLMPYAYADAFTTRLPALRLGEFLAGMMLARLIASGWRPNKPLLVGSAGLASAVLFTGWSAQVPRGLTVLPGAVMLIAWAARAERSWLASRVMVRLGEQSYALFLSHAVVLPLIAVALPATLWQALLIDIAVALGMAAALHYGVERPLERLLRGGPRLRKPAVRLSPNGTYGRPWPAATDGARKALEGLWSSTEGQGRATSGEPAGQKA